jgi:hypothetical protein
MFGQDIVQSSIISVMIIVVFLFYYVDRLTRSTWIAKAFAADYEYDSRDTV